MADNKTTIIISAVDQTQTAFNSIRRALGLLGVSLSAASFASMVKGTIDSADALGKAAQKAGITTEALSGLKYAASLSNIEFDSLQTGVKKLNTNLTDAARGNAAAQASFTALGIGIKNTDGTIKGTEQTLLDIADAFQKMPAGAQKADLAVKLFGKSGTDLIPMLNEGKAGIQKLTAEAERLGVVISGKTAADAEKFNDNMTRLGTGVDGIKNKIGIGLLPVMNELADRFMAAGGGMDEFGKNTKGALDQANIMAWAKNALVGLAWVADAAHGVYVVVSDAGKVIGAIGAEMVALAHGDMQAYADIQKQLRADLAKSVDYTPMVDKTNAFFEELSRTVTYHGTKILADTAEHAAAAQAIYDEMAGAEKAALTGVTVKTSEELAKQKAVADKYAEEFKKTTLGVHDYAVSKIKERYQIELDAIKGMANEYALAAEINRKMDDEIAAIASQYQDKRITGEAVITAAVLSESQKRLGIEQGAASAVTKFWNQANAVKAAQTGGDVVNAGTAGEFVSSWAGNNYVGDLGFATGGSFMVGGSGSADTTPVRFMATPGERVTVQTPEQQRSGGGSIVIQNLNLPGISDAQEFVKQLRQMLRTDPNLLTVGTRAG